MLNEGLEKEAIEEVARFVSELIDEQLVLAYASGVFQGGRRFLKPSALTEEVRRRCTWITSWRRTYDWRV